MEKMLSVILFIILGILVLSTHNDIKKVQKQIAFVEARQQQIFLMTIDAYPKTKRQE
jgi:uncharacterized membrane protein SirB2